MSIWVSGKVISIKHWTDQLFSLIIRAPVSKFFAGQFVKIGMMTNNFFVYRAYSYLNAPMNPDLEFYVVVVPSGRLTPTLQLLYPGSDIMITEKAYGQFTLEKIPISCKNLWMLATGTGISPYLSILESKEKRLNMFSHIILVHAVRFFKDLSYLSKMFALKKFFSGKLHVYTVLSREKSSHSFYGRIPNLIDNGLLEKQVGLYLSRGDSHIMLCGNPNMIFDTKKILYKKYGFQSHSQRNPGNITQERYW